MAFFAAFSRAWEPATSAFTLIMGALAIAEARISRVSTSMAFRVTFPAADFIAVLRK